MNGRNRRFGGGAAALRVKRAREGVARAPDGRLHPAGLTAAARFAASLASPGAARLFEAVAGRRDAGADVPALSAGLDTRERTEAAAASFVRYFGVDLIRIDGDGAWQASDDALLEALFTPLAPSREGSGPAAALDAAASAWLPVVEAATRSGRGHHLALRTPPGESRPGADFAEALAARAIVEVVHAGNLEILSLSILRAELHGGERPCVVLLDADLAFEGACEGDAGVDEPEREAEPLAMRPEIVRLLPTLGALRNTYVWRMPAKGLLPRELVGVVGGCIGPIVPDAGRGVAAVVAAHPRIGAAGARALLGRAGDPRDVGAMAAMAEAAVSTGFASAEAACRFVAGSFGGRPTSPSIEAAVAFDERLLCCDDDGLALLDRGEALGRGGRVLACGPPGGGKSTYAAALAERVAAASGRCVIRVEPAELLARPLGAMERLVAALWARARREHATLLADEFDSMCVRREADAPASGNAYLIRCLTNEWLRQLDAHPEVPLIATVNDASVVDAAVRRRFDAVVEVGGELSPYQERLAWAIVLLAHPPEGWVPCGAAIADFGSALARSRLTGRGDAASLAGAVAAARTVRTGRGGAKPPHAREGPLH